jgi:hypothetical protein
VKALCLCLLLVTMAMVAPTWAEEAHVSAGAIIGPSVLFLVQQEGDAWATTRGQRLGGVESNSTLWGAHPHGAGFYLAKGGFAVFQETVDYTLRRTHHKGWAKAWEITTTVLYGVAIAKTGGFVGRTR